MRRKQLKGVANTLGQWCISRNFDCQGYWAIGKLYKLAQKNDQSVVVIDITESEIDPEPTDEELKGLITLIRNFYQDLLKANKLHYFCVKKIIITFQFEQKYQNKYHLWRVSIGKPVIVKVNIQTDLGRTYESENGCNCRPHNKDKEQRRNGY